MKCKIVTSLVKVPDNKHAAFTFYRQEVRCMCEVHGWHFNDGQPMTSESLCPIGMIEQATDLAVERIQHEGAKSNGVTR